ncbi:MAG: flotillin domain-containing protein [Gammaproteobacteria bacterium]|nr:flotillin domain-containing protein [Gammaproteobacteria bacterium]
MELSQFGYFLLLLVTIAIVLGILIWLIHLFYIRSSKEKSFVRTGLGGEKVVLGGGAFVLPFIHDITPVNMNTLRLEISRGKDKALITKDRMRVDVVSEFFVRVATDKQAVSSAAQTLGLRTLEPSQLREQVEGKFVDALRTIAAEMTLEELHEKRGSYIKQVKDLVAETLTKNGLELEAASLTQLDQTELTYFNPSNVFDAEGLTRLTEQIEFRKKQRNDVEQDTLIAIRNKNLTTEKLSLDLDKEGEFARILQQQAIEFAKSKQKSDLVIDHAIREQDAESAKIATHESIHKAKVRSELILEQERIAKEKALQVAEIDRRKSLELAEQNKLIELAIESEKVSKAQIDADLARALAVETEEKVFTAREIELAERKKRIDLIAASQDAERAMIKVVKAAQTENQASLDKGNALKNLALAESEAEKLRIAVKKLNAEADASALREHHLAENTLSDAARLSAFRLKLIDNAAQIIHESVKPMERIESIKILQVDGLVPHHGNPIHPSANTTQPSFSDQLIDSALRYRAQAPLVDKLLNEIGIYSGKLPQFIPNPITDKENPYPSSEPKSTSGPPIE